MSRQDGHFGLVPSQELACFARSSAWSPVASLGGEQLLVSTAAVGYMFHSECPAGSNRLYIPGLLVILSLSQCFGVGLEHSSNLTVFGWPPKRKWVGHWGREHRPKFSDESRPADQIHRGQLKVSQVCQRDASCEW